MRWRVTRSTEEKLSIVLQPIVHKGLLAVNFLIDMLSIFFGMLVKSRRLFFMAMTRRRRWATVLEWLATTFNLLDTAALVLQLFLFVMMQRRSRRRSERRMQRLWREQAHRRPFVTWSVVLREKSGGGARREEIGEDWRGSIHYTVKGLTAIAKVRFSLFYLICRHDFGSIWLHFRKIQA
jgi:hypothetical protein